MTKLCCDVCGGKIMMRAGGKSGACVLCATEYSIERMREMLNSNPMGIFNTNSNESDIEQLKKLCKRYISNFEYKSAYEISKRLISICPDDIYAKNMHNNLSDWINMTVDDGILIKYEGNSSIIKIPIGVTSIEEAVFSGNEHIKKLYTPETLIYIGKNAFKNCIKLEKVSMTDGIRSIGSSAFEKCTALKTVNLPESITYIGDKAFCETAIYKIEIPENIVYISDKILYGCKNLKSISIPANVVNIGSNAFTDCMSLSNVVIPSSVIYIGNRAFYNCQNISTIDLSFNTSYIGNEAFYNCTSISELELPVNLSGIGENTFAKCSSLENITIPENVTTIGINAFKDCCSLTQVHFENHTLRVDLDKTFVNTPFLWRVRGTIKGVCEDVDFVEIPFGVTEIGMCAFENHTKIRTVKIPDTVRVIGKSAFKGCKNLTNIVLPTNLLRIGANAFEDCERIFSITIPPNVTFIGESAFCGCTGIKSLRIPPQVSIIGSGAFAKCSQLENVRLENSDIEIDMGNIFDKTPFHHLYKRNKIQFEQRQKRMQQGICVECGGKFGGMFSKVCLQCGKVKDY